MDLSQLPQLVPQLVSRGVHNTSACTLNTCPVEWSVYGYQPSLGATVFFLIAYALSGAVHLFQGFQFKTWFFAVAMAIGCLAEVLGYVSKMLLWQNPFSNVGFKMSLVMLTIAPAFYSAGIYFTLKHITLTFGESYSRLKPALFTPVFISCDLVSIILQAAGGALAAISSGKNDSVGLDRGDHVMVAGLALQVFTLIVFAVLVIDYAITAYKNKHNLNSQTASLRESRDFKLFLGALTLAFILIVIRCAYRVAELSGGWSLSNDILRNQPLFIGLDSTMCLIATVLLNVWHPGRCFPSVHPIYNAEKDIEYSSLERVHVRPKH